MAEEPTMIDEAKNVMVHAGVGWIMQLLIALSVASAAISLDRARAYWRERRNVADLGRELHRLLAGGDTEAARAQLIRVGGVVADVALAGLARWDGGAQAAREAMAAATGLARARLQRGLLVLGTIGNNAPFVGLLGTVIGVIGAFDELGRTGSAAAARSAFAPERVMATIAEALVATAAGLVVAIPAVALFNYFQGRLAATLAAADTLGHVLLAHVDGRSGEDVES